jgi:hypothetical protein
MLEEFKEDFRDKILYPQRHKNNKLYGLIPNAAMPQTN